MNKTNKNFRKGFIFGNEYKKKITKEAVELTETSELRVNPYDNSDFVYRGKIKCTPQN